MTSHLRIDILGGMSAQGNLSRAPSGREEADQLAKNSWLMNWLRNLLYVALTIWLRVACGYRVEGREHLRGTGPFVFISNHSSHADPVVLLAALPAGLRNRCFSAAAEDYFYKNPFRQLSARLFANTFPFHRQGSGAQASLAAAARILARGDCLILYPEGTRTTTGKLQRFRKGIGLLVQGTDYPVVPVWIDGTYDMLRKGRWFPRINPVRLRIGEPVRFPSSGTEDETAVAIANTLHDRVAELAPEPQPAASDEEGDPDESSVD